MDAPKMNLMKSKELARIVCTALLVMIISPFLNATPVNEGPEHAISVQPLGALFTRTGIEYEQAMSWSKVPVSLAGRVNMTSDVFGRTDWSHFDQQSNVTGWYGVGASIRAYYTESVMYSFYFGLNVDFYTGDYESSSETVSGSFTLLGFEAGRKITFGDNGNGLFIMPSAQYMLYVTKDVPYNFNNYTYSIGIGIGYQF